MAIAIFIFTLQCNDSMRSEIISELPRFDMFRPDFRAPKIPNLSPLRYILLTVPDARADDGRARQKLLSFEIRLITSHCDSSELLAAGGVGWLSVFFSTSVLENGALTNRDSRDSGRHQIIRSVFFFKKIETNHVSVRAFCSLQRGGEQGVASFEI